MEETMKKDLVQEVKNEKKKETKSTVTVCCAYPMGLKLLVKGQEVVLKGVPVSHLVSATKLGTPLPAGKYGTTVLDKSLWEAILSEYKNHDFIKKEFVFAEESLDSALNKGQALLKAGKKTGFEQASKKGKTQPKSDED